MNTKELYGILEHLVSKEVSKQLPMLLQELLSNSPSKPAPSRLVNEIVEEEIAPTKSFKELMNSNVIPVSSRTTTKKTYTKDPILNAVLNETVNDLGLRESGRGPNVALDSEFPTTMTSEDGMVTTIPKSESVLDFKRDPEVKKVLDRDFSSILKKSYQKRS